MSAFLSRQIRLSARKKFGRRFTHGDKNFAMSLYFCGPKAYSFCQQLFVLPSKRTLQLWLSTLNIAPGFCDTVLSLLGKKVSRMDNLSKLCVLLLDEMSLKSSLTYDASRDVVVGFENFGHLGAGTLLCNNALVFMVKGVCAKWKQPIGYFLSNNATSVDKLVSLVTTAVGKLTDVGLDVRVVVCDQGSTNQQMLKQFGITVEKPFAELQGKQVMFMYDPPHLIKSIRNNLVKHNFHVSGNTVSWKYISDFYGFDSKLPSRMAPKLTKKHIELPAFSAMRVCLATQALSHTVAAGISTYVALGQLPDEALHTAEFLEAVDGLFDCFNSRNLKENKALRRPLTDGSQSSHLTHLNKCTNLLQTLQVGDATARPPCVKGWLMNINALQMLWSLFKNQYNMTFLLTSRLNQDSLENLFSIIRGRGGHRDNPNPVHFQAAFKQVIVRNMFMPASNANCTADDESDCVLNVDDFIGSTSSAATVTRDKSMSCSSAYPIPVLADEDSFLAIENQMPASFDMTEQNTLMYLTGYVCKKVLDKHICQRCKSAMLRSDTMLIQQTDLFCVHKAYNAKRGNFGGLKAPSQFMFDLITCCKEVFTSMFDTVKHKQGIRMILNRAMERHLAEADEKPCMASQKCAADLYLRTRLHYKLKFLSRDLSSKCTSKRKNRKAMKLLHK